MPPSHSELIKFKNVPALVYEIYGVKVVETTIHKWRSKGRRSGDGTKIVKLKTTKRIGRIFTTEKWIREFVTEIS